LAVLTVMPPDRSQDHSVDTYGGAQTARGGASRGKDPTKVTALLLIVARYLAKERRRRGLAREITIH